MGLFIVELESLSNFFLTSTHWVKKWSQRWRTSDRFSTQTLAGAANICRLQKGLRGVKNELGDNMWWSFILRLLSLLVFCSTVVLCRLLDISSSRISLYFFKVLSNYLQLSSALVLVSKRKKKEVASCKPWLCWSQHSGFFSVCIPLYIFFFFSN